MKLLTFPELKEKKGIRYSASHVWRLVRAGKFPKPVHLGPNCIAWVETEIDAHIERKIAERDQPASSQVESPSKRKAKA